MRAPIRCAWDRRALLPRGCHSAEATQAGAERGSSSSGAAQHYSAVVLLPTIQVLGVAAPTQ